MLKSFANIFRVPELRNKVLFTLFMLMIYRVGYHIPLPGIDQAAFGALEQGDAASRLAAYVSLFSGGDLSQSTIFGLGVMPYISASIIFQLLGTTIPALEKLKKEGQTGQRKIQEWTRYATVPIAALQSIFLLSYMGNQGLIMPALEGSFTFWVLGTLALTTGCIFLMWLGEQIDEYGLGNGVSLIILAGIVARMPAAIGQLISGFDATGSGTGIGVGQIIFLIASFTFVVMGSILITQAQRRIPIQQAKHTRGRKVYGGQKQFLPLRVNHGGVMPIIFAQSLMLFPGMLLGYLDGTAQNQGWDGFFGTTFAWLNTQFAQTGFIYIITEVILIYFFAYFWTTVQFQPKEMANQLRDYGSFIPGLRPGKRTADYLERVMMRITFVGAAFLSIIAIIPMVVAAYMGIPWEVSAFLGGTGLLIVVSVALDMVQRIEANLVMRNYSGFLSDGPGTKGKRIKGRSHEAVKIILKSRREMELMRKSGFIAHTVIKTLCDAAEPGMTTDELDRLGAKVLQEHGAISMNRWYPTYKPGEGYPATICISVNDEVVHGIPSKRKLESGDVVTFDLGMKFQDHCADHAWTVGIGELDEASTKLIEHGKSTLKLALETMEPGRKWSDIARLMQHHAEEAGYGVVQEFVGHGIGKTMHEDPKVPNFVTPEQLKGDFVLRPGLTVAVEPMLIVGPRYVEQLDDDWTIVAKNGGKACHFEHTVAVTADGVDVLTDGREAWGI